MEALNAFFAVQNARLSQERRLAKETAEVADGVAELNEPGPALPAPTVVTVQPSEDWIKLQGALNEGLQSIAHALQREGDSKRDWTWPTRASGAALYVLRMLAQVRVTLLDAHPGRTTSTTGTALCEDINRNLAQIAATGAFQRAREMLEKCASPTDQRPLSAPLGALVAPLSATPSLQEAVALRLHDVAMVEYLTLQALDQPWPMLPDLPDPYAAPVTVPDTKAQATTPPVSAARARK